MTVHSRCIQSCLVPPNNSTNGRVQKTIRACDVDASPLVVTIVPTIVAVPVRHVRRTHAQPTPTRILVDARRDGRDGKHVGAAELARHMHDDD
jgi:hypothetical protein